MVALSLPARAECLGHNCYQGLGWFIAFVVAVALTLLAVAIYVVVLLFRRQWRNAGKVAGTTLLLAWPVAAAVGL
jgi:hypothetical protein